MIYLKTNTWVEILSLYRELFGDTLFSIFSFLLICIVLGLCLYILYHKGFGSKIPAIKELIKPVKKEYEKVPGISSAAEIIVNKEKVGFVIPDPFVKIYGNYWNSSEHKDIYDKFERNWDYIHIIDVTDCNITSRLISCIVNKSKKHTTTVICRSEQEPLLKIFDGYSKVKIKKVEFE